MQESIVIIRNDQAPYWLEKLVGQTFCCKKSLPDIDSENMKRMLKEGHIIKADDVLAALSKICPNSKE